MYRDFITVGADQGYEDVRFLGSWTHAMTTPDGVILRDVEARTVGYKHIAFDDVYASIYWNPYFDVKELLTRWEVDKAAYRRNI